ncbi:MAG: hypothetical protein ACOYL6_07740 [Bacteriovoracaceae bacterium]
MQKMKLPMAILSTSLALSCTARANSVLESITLKSHVKALHEVVRDLKLHARLESSFLSLGESHLQASTTTPLNFMLANQFLDAREKDVTFCTENIADFLASTEGKQLTERTLKTKIMKGNSPATTDFTSCEDGSLHYLTYSGFFHQYAFARAFPLEFTQTPVITGTGNTILEQMKKSKGLFITQMELDYLEMTATSGLLKSKIRNSFVFNKKLKNLNKKIETLHKEMQLLVDGELATKNKFGIFLSPQHFKVGGLIMPENSFILITDLESHMIEKAPFTFLERMNNLRNSKLNDLLKFLEGSKFYFTKALTEANDDGTYPETGYGTLPQIFKGKSEFLEIRKDQTHFVMVAEPNTDGFLCYLEKGETYVNTDCLSLF